jgi:CBS domain-containing protein
MTIAPTRVRRDAEAMLVSDVMHEGFVGCAYETPLTVVARLMAQHRVHCVVGFGDVTEDDTSLWGVVSDRDVVDALASGALPATAGSIAATEAVTVEPGDTLRHAAQLMRDHAVSHVLVVNRDSDRPVGILSTLDIAAVIGDVDRL